ncbi:MAG: hypothetical protein Q7S20_13570 [Gemmatimonadaceae bacterium]|nr:hypothetical protein [Gemmatimonadaceae bacterium]
MKPRTRFLLGGVLVPGTFRATTLLAKCASRHENAPEKYKETSGYRSTANGA